MSLHYYVYDTSIGNICIVESDSFISYVGLGSCPYVDALNIPTPLIERTAKQLREYLEGKRQVFELPIKAAGSDFMKKVWSELEKIPYGQTVSYKDIAIKVGREKAYRAVGGACNKNPILIIIPCHRVVGSNGNLTGYALGVNIKNKLLELEIAK